MFKGMRILLVPRINDAVEKFRIKIWREQGIDVRDKRYLSAQLKRKQKPNTPKDSLYILANDLAQPDQLKLEIAKIRSNNTLGFPIVRSEWLTKSLDAKKLLPYTNFAYRAKRERNNQKISVKRAKVEKDSKVSKPNRAQKIITLLQSNKNKKEKRIIDHTPLRTNNVIIDKFNEMINLLEIDKFVNSSDEFRITQYRNAIKLIQTLTVPVLYTDDLKDTYGFGKGLRQHVQEILDTGTFEKYEMLKQKVAKDKTCNLVKEICNIHGFGPASAFKILEKFKVSKMEELTTNKELYSSFTRQQKLGIKYNYDWSQRIPRDEVTELYERLLTIIGHKPLVEGDNQPVIRIMGSYVRGVKTCGDIDLMMYQKGENDPKKLHRLLYKLVKTLERENFIDCELTDVSPKMSKFNGSCVLNQGKGMLHRRIDIITVEYDRLGGALLYFVGNETFNRGLRMLAILNNERLSDQGLVKLVTDKQGVQREEMVESFDEKKILDHLGVGWIDYTDRNI